MRKKLKKQNSKFNSNDILFISITLIIIFLDQLTKRLFDKGFLGVVTTHNTGAAFSILQGANGSLMWFSIFVIGIILFYYDKIPKNKFVYAAVALLFAGIVGNTLDRMFLGYVIDFIDLGFWPSFNIADSAICVGAVGLIVYYWKKG